MLNMTMMIYHQNNCKNPLNFVYNQNKEILNRNMTKEIRKLNPNRLSQVAEQSLLGIEPKLYNIKESSRYSKPKMKQLKEIYNIQNKRFQPDFRIQHFLDKDLPTFKDLNDDNDYDFPTTKRSNLNNIFKNNFIFHTEKPLHSQDSQLNKNRQIHADTDNDEDSSTPEIKIKSERNQTNKIQSAPINEDQSSSSSNPSLAKRPTSNRISILDDDDKRIYQKPDYDEHDKMK